MKILILSFYYPPDLCAGSFRTSALVDALLKNLPKNSHVDVITTLPNRYSSFANEALEYETFDCLTIHRIRLSTHQSGMIDQAKAFTHYMRKVLPISKQKNYDLIYGTSSRLMTAVLSAYIAKRNDTILYLDIRDIFADTIKDVLPKKIAFFAKPVFELIEQFAISNASKVNLVSQGFQDYFTSRYPNQTFSFFTNGIDDEFIVPSTTPITNVQTRPPIILYAGNIGEGQGLHEIIPELAARLRNKFHFRIIGDGGRKELLEQAISKSNAHNVELLPPIGRNQLLAEYQQADILFLHLNNYPAFDKVLPSKIFEYASVGKPVLAGVPGYSAQFIATEVENAAVFPPCDIEKAAQALENLALTHTDRTDFIHKYNRTHIMDDMAKDILSIYHGKKST